MPRRMTPLEKAERIAKIVAMRGIGMLWDHIGKEFGITGSMACKIYKQALVDHPTSAMAIDEYRLEELLRIETQVRAMSRIVMDERTDAKGNPRVSPRTRVEASNALRGWAERKAKLLGLDAPAQVQVTSIDAFDQQIRELEIALDYKPGQEIVVPSEVG